VAAFGPDGRIVAGQWHGDLQFLDPKSGEPRGKLPFGGITAAAFSPDGRRLVTAHLPDQGRLVPNRPEGAWRVRDAATGEVLKEVGAFRYPWSVAFSPSGWLLAVAGDNAVRVYETASWGEVACLDGHEGTVRSVFFGPDDGTLVSASSEDGTALVWDLRPPAGGEPPDPATLWADLAADGPTAARAVWAAARHPGAVVKLFRDKWPVTDNVDAGRVRRLIEELDGPRFAAREAATAELMKLGRRAEGEVRRALAEARSAEAKQRLEQVLDRLKQPALAELPAEDARELRAARALELAGTAEARQLLADWGAAKVGARLCEESTAALKRLPPDSR
jgi:hypothetical protein